MNIIERFNAKWRFGDTGCHEWTAAKYYNGYGVFCIAGCNHTAHRAAWMLFKGDIAPGLDVCHACDNKGCVNVDHLFLGTRSENMMDRVRKGRHPRKPNKGRENGRAKLTDEIVSAIRKDPRTHAEIARELGVSEFIISQARRRLSWKHVS